MFWDKGEKIQLSEHFNTLEFQCKCNFSSCKRQKIDTLLIEKLENLREELGGKPIRIHSAYRCMKHNDDIGSMRFSQHPTGCGADISCFGYGSGELSQYAENATFDGIGVYDTFIHVDIRGQKAKWRN